MSNFIEQIKLLFKNEESASVKKAQKDLTCALRLSYNNFDEKWNQEEDFYGECKH